MDLPRQLGPYRLIRRLGHGGMAEVFLATAFGASGFEKRVAVKTLLPELSGEAEVERLLIEEARLGARLSHRNLVGVHDLGVDGGVYYVCMDHVDGPDLATLIAAEPLPVSLALLVAEEVAHALAYVHEVTDEAGRPLGLVHRDVSPGNVLLSRNGEVKLADLGIAKATFLAETTRAGIRRGKHGYMSPEQVAGEPLTAHSDQFALGVTLMELLTGRRPFDGASPAETVDLIREAAPPDVSGLDPDLAAVVTRCLARRPAERFDDAELLQELGAARRARSAVGPGDLARRVRGSIDETGAAPRRPTRPITGG